MVCVKEREGYQHRLQGLIALNPASNSITSSQKSKKITVLKQFIVPALSKKARNSRVAKKLKKQLAEKILRPCGILLHPGSAYASLAPVSQTVTACKYLKVKHLKLHFKFSEVFHRVVENSVENPSRSSKRELKREVLQHLPVISSTVSLSISWRRTVLF
jgi:hypothetical protein